MSLLVLDGNERSALAAVRAVGAAGIEVTVGQDTRHSLASSSRFCAKILRLPSPKAEPTRFCDALLRALRTDEFAAIFAMTDVSTLLLASIRDHLPEHLQRSVPSARQVSVIQDKLEVLRAAARVGIVGPMTECPSNLQEVTALTHRFNFPVVLKPRRSKTLLGEHWVTGGVSFPADVDQLLRALVKYDLAQMPVMVQEQLQGDGEGVFLLVWNGELKAAFCHRRLREKPPWGGVSVLRESLAADAGLIARSHALLQEIGWNGIAMVELKRDHRDNLPKLMEINGRFWGSLQLCLDAGLNLPLMLYRLIIGESVTPQFEYQVGVRSRWFLGDLDWLLIRLRNRRYRSHRLQSIREFAATGFGSSRNEVFRWRDVRPGFYEAYRYLLDHLPSADRQARA